MAIKPIVDGVEKKYSGKLMVMRINVQSDLGRALTEPYKFQYTPTFIYFNPQGVEEWRQVGGLDLKKLSTFLGP